MIWRYQPVKQILRFIVVTACAARIFPCFFIVMRITRFIRAAKIPTRTGLKRWRMSAGTLRRSEARRVTQNRGNSDISLTPNLYTVLAAANVHVTNDVTIPVNSMTLHMNTIVIQRTFPQKRVNELEIILKSTDRCLNIDLSLYAQGLDHVHLTSLISRVFRWNCFINNLLLCEEYIDNLQC